MINNCIHKKIGCNQRNTSEQNLLQEKKLD